MTPPPNDSHQKRSGPDPEGYANYVEHPRFGRGPRFTRLNPIEGVDKNVHLHWHTPKRARIPMTAIVADVSRQTPAMFPVTHYFDSGRICDGCKRPFLFFAEEQRHWYEVLGFPLEADALKCVPCRKLAQGLARAHARYDELFHLERTVEQDFEFAECCLALIGGGESGVRVVERARALFKGLPDGQRLQGLRARLESAVARPEPDVDPT